MNDDEIATVILSCVNLESLILCMLMKTMRNLKIITLCTSAFLCRKLKMTNLNTKFIEGRDEETDKSSDEDQTSNDDETVDVISNDDKTADGGIMSELIETNTNDMSAIQL